MKWRITLLLAAILTLAATAGAQGNQQDYLTQSEASQIRDAESTNERVKLFLDFGAEHLRRFQYELHTANAGPRRADYLNDLLNVFSDCVDEADSRVQDALDHGEDVRGGIKDIQKRAPEFLAELKKVKGEGTDLKLYQDSLDDAVEEVEDAIKDAQKAQQRVQATRPQTKPHSQERP